MNKKIALFFILFANSTITLAKTPPVTPAPAPPVITEDNLNLTAKELQEIQKQQPSVIRPRSEADKGRSVRVTQSENGDKVEEYYQGSQVFQIKVTPKYGKPYFIQPQNADESDPTRTNPTSNWKLFDF